MNEEDIDRYIDEMLTRMTRASQDDIYLVPVPDVVRNAVLRARADLRAAKNDVFPTDWTRHSESSWHAFEVRAAASSKDTGGQMATLWSAEGVFLTCLYDLNWEPGDPPIALMLGCREDLIAQFRGCHIQVMIGNTEIDMGMCDDEGKVKAPWPKGLQLRPRFLYRKNDTSGGELR